MLWLNNQEIKRTDLQRNDLSVSGREVVQVRVDFSPGAPATLKSFLSLTHLMEPTRDTYDSKGFITDLLADHERIIIQLREMINHFANDFGDLGTSDFITGLMENHEKMAWFLRSHIK